jgi:hypothetical protein
VPLPSGRAEKIMSYRNTLKTVICLVKIRNKEYHELMKGKRCFREFGRS